MLEKSDASQLIIRNARVIDPYAGLDEKRDVFIDDGVISDRPAQDPQTIDAKGMIVCPGLMDIHVHLREPGQTHKEDIETGTAAAAAGGFTFVACMPNTRPALDNPEQIRKVREKTDSVGSCSVGPMGTITRDRAGEELADLAAMREAGAVAFTDDGDGVENDAVMRAAFAAAKSMDAVLVQHCEYRDLSAGGVMHLGKVSKQLGVPGLDPRSEEAMIERDIGLCRETGGRYHVAHISTAAAVELVRQAKKEGLPVTSEVCTHHLVLTDDACRDTNPDTKMHPPLRPEMDVTACRQGLLDGTIDCIVTDHAPHAAEEKAAGFLKAPPGIVGLETAVSLVDRAMIKTGLADWADVVRWFTSGPSEVLGLPSRPLRTGMAADLSIIDPRHQWFVDLAQFESRSRNSPFHGWKLDSAPVATIWRGVLCRKSGSALSY
ncbi:MAG: dihydroorotase [Planctomycetota bacterium]|jgi:dihydroorotase